MYQAAQLLSAPIAAALQALLACVTGGGKLLACGNGASADAARQFAGFCVCGFERARPELAALALGCAADAGAADEAGQFARQVRALGQAGDVLLLLSVSGNEANLLAAASAAHERDMSVLLLTGRSGGKLATLLRETDVLIAVPSERPARVRELHALVLHCLSDAVDAQLLGEPEGAP